MVEKAAPITHPQPAPTAPNRGIPAQRSRGGQPDLRRVTLPHPAPSMPVPDPPTDEQDRADEPPPHAPDRTPRPDDWLHAHRPSLISRDGAVIILAILAAQFVTLDVNFSFGFTWPTQEFAWLVGIVVAVSWLVLLAVEGVWDISILQNSKLEHRRILLASLMVFAGVGIVGYLTMTNPARTYLLVAAPLGIAGLFVNHWYFRRRFNGFRRSMGLVHGVMTVGDFAGAGGLLDGVRDRHDSGFEVNGVWVLRDPDSGIGPRAADRVGVHGASPLGDRTHTAAATAADPGVVAVVSPPMLSQDRPPMPTLSVRQLIVKKTMDLAVAVISLLVLAPLLVIAAAMVLLADGGPVLHQQEFAGRGGKVFKNWTFRCTPYGAKARPALGDGPSGRALRAEYDVATTSIGRLLRRTGLSCAPGLFNVLAGEMSIVGPRPVPPGDVAAHPLTVRPGLTGPWRLSDARDSRYVENWSVGGDIKIIARSMKLAVTGKLPC